MKYTIFNPKTGVILRVVNCQDIHLQVHTGEEFADGDYPDDRYYWDNGFVEIPEKPSEYHQFDYELKQWVEISNAKLDETRAIRNFLLKESDWTQVSDSPLSPEKKAEWAEYRQKLRDITNQDINLVVFPDKP